MIRSSFEWSDDRWQVLGGRARDVDTTSRGDDDGRARAIAETSNEGITNSWIVSRSRIHVHCSSVRARARDVEDERCDGHRDDAGTLQSRGARVRRAQELGERRSVS